MSCPNLNEINEWLVIGMRPQVSGEAVTIGSSNELGANRAVVTSNANYTGPNPSVIDGTNTNVFPKINFVDGPEAGPESLSRALAPSGLRNVFIPSPGSGNNPSFNRWFTGAAEIIDNLTPDSNFYPNNDPVGPNVDYLPYTFQGQQRQARTVRGVDWSGNVAVTSNTGTFSLQDISIFGDIGIKSTSNTAADDIENSYYFPQGSLDGLLMSDAAPNPARGWTGNANFSQLLTHLRNWRDFIRGLPADRLFNQDVPGNDIVNRNSINNLQWPFVYFVPDAWDTNNDGIIVIDIPDDGTDFAVNNSDWVIESSGNKLIIFRIRGRANMLISNSSIMLGEQFTDNIGARKTGVLFVKVHPEEEFTSPSGSSDTVFNLSNVIMNGIGLWDLNTIGDANTDIAYGGNANRINQNNYTNIRHSNTQGCGQFISPFVNMQNVRWQHCEVMGPFEEEPEISIEKLVSPDNGVTWFDADNPPGPNVLESTDPQFRFIVTNTGNVTLTNVQVTDDVYGLIGTLPSLSPGASAQFNIVGTWALGQQVNTATATGDYNDQTVEDTDPAYWFGVEEETPAIDVEKEVSPDDGVIWFDADTPTGPLVVQGTDPQFRFTVTNIGNVTLTNVSFEDDVLGTISVGGTLEPGQSVIFNEVGTWALGQQVNTATATGDYNGQTVSDSDSAHWVGIIVLVQIEKYVSVDNGETWLDANTPPGPLLPSGGTPQFRYVVTNTGSVTLTNITVNDNVYGPITLPTTTLLPGESTEAIISG